MTYRIVFVHIGKSLPPYVNDALLQAYLFNGSEVYLIANVEAISGLHSELRSCITVISCESIGVSSKHAEFLGIARIDRQFRNGFWLHTTERFYLIESAMRKYNLENVFHLENDNLLYADLREMLPVFVRNYRGIAATFDDDNRCIPGFMYFRNLRSIERLTQLINYVFITTNCRYNDMQLLGIFRKTFGPNAIDTLPIVPYRPSTPLVSLLGRKPESEAIYHNHINEFKSVFDAAAIGQYLGGIDPQNSDGRNTAGFINETCIFNPSHFRYEWVKDKEGRKIPFMLDNETRYRINNLHIHCKQLSDFSSETTDRRGGGAK